MIKIGLTRIYTKNQDLKYNFEQIEKLYKNATKNNLEVLIFPRMSINGLVYNRNNLDLGFDLLEKIIDLTKNQTCKILLGDIYINEKFEQNNILYNEKIFDSIFFIENGTINSIVLRKNILKNNILNDYKIFETNNFLNSIKYNKKKINILIADDIFTDFNIILTGEQKPNYIICLDSSNYENDFKIKQLLKLAKFAKCPLIYLNSANYYNEEIQFNGELIIIDEDFNVVKNDLYKSDEIFEINIDNEDGSEIFFPKKIKANKNNIFILKKEFCSKQLVINCCNFDKNQLINIKNNIKNVKFINFVEFGKKFDYLSAENLKISDYVNLNFFKKLSEKNKRDILCVILENFF